MPLPALAADPPVRPVAEPPVTNVTLSNAGLMQIDRAGMLGPEEVIGFAVPVEAVDDVLKSLLLRDPAGQAGAVRLPAQDLEAEAFRGLPVRPGDFETSASLFRALRGQAVEAGGASGRLAGADEAEGGLRLSLLTPTGLRVLALAEGAEVRLQDPALAARLTRAAEALAASRSADIRRLEITLAGATAAREVGLSYVAAAPLWKPTWRIIIPEGQGDKPGEARLQGWAVVENRSGADWDGVRLSLVSGNPAAFAQPIYAPILMPRPVLPVRSAERVVVEADTGPRPAPPPPMAAAMAAPAPMLRRAPAAEAPPLAALPTAQAAASPGRVAFTLPGAVSLRGGETANLPFLDAALPAERIWWVQDLAARSPLNAVRLVNSTTHVLPDGLAAVYGATGAEAGAWLGDAELRAMAPGEARIIAFARDRDVLLSATQSSTEQPVTITLQRGVVLIGTRRREETALAVDPRGGRGKLVLDLSRRPGATPQFTVVAEGDFGLRTEAMLDGSASTLRLGWEREGRQEVPLWDTGLGDPVRLRWREIDVEEALRRLPGGPGSLETLQAVLERLPEAAPGRAALAGVVAALAEARRLLDAARGAIRTYAITDAMLGRARAAVEDRTGAAREEARKRLTEASQAAERAGAAADAAWEAWQRAVQAVLARTG
jgi:hypothetical protein